MFLFPFKKKGTICQCKIGKERKKKKGKGELLTSEPSYCSLKNCLTIKEVYVSIFYSKKGNKNVLFCNCKIITSELQRDHPSSVVYKYFNVLEAPMKTNTPYNFVASFIEQNREHTFIGLMKKICNRSLSWHKTPRVWINFLINMYNVAQIFFFYVFLSSASTIDCRAAIRKSLSPKQLVTAASLYGSASKDIEYHAIMFLLPRWLFIEFIKRCFDFITVIFFLLLCLFLYNI